MSDEQEQLQAWAHLTCSDAIGAEGLRRLIMHAGSAAAAMQGGPRLWRESGLREASIASLAKPQQQRIQRTLEWLADPAHHLVTFLDSDYPALLNDIRAAPAALFVAGDVDALWRPQLAIVGSRSASEGGLRNAAAFARDLSRRGLCITSGLAAGIDAAAHHASIDEQGGSIAVVGTGPDQVYPARHGALARRIIERGALVSEFAPGTPPLANHFPRRNRIIAGLSLGTLVVEAGLRSGSLITARLATEAGRDVLAIPGSIHNPLARGCHQLIRQGASLVETSQDVLDAITPLAQRLGEHLRGRLDGGGMCTVNSSPDTSPASGELDEDYRQLLDCMGHDPIAIDELVERSGLTVASVSSMLLMLELNGRVAAGRGGTYSRLDETR